MEELEFVKKSDFKLWINGSKFSNLFLLLVLIGISITPI